MIKYILFDFDGTIADTFPFVKKYCKEIAERYSLYVNFEEARALGLKRALIEFEFPIFKLPKISKEIKKRLLKEDILMIRGINEVLRELAKSYSLGIVSTNSENNVRRFLLKYGLNEIFDFVYSDASLFGKNVVLKKVFRERLISKEEVIFVGDEDRDVRAAKKLGIQVVAVSWGYNSRGLLEKEKPDYLIDSPKELLNLSF